MRHRPEGIDELLASQRGMASARFFVYRDALPWFGPAMAEAGWPATSEATRAVLARAHQAWTELTGLAPLATVDAWRDVLALTAEPGDILDLEWTEARRRVSAWVKRQRWEEANAAGRPGSDELPDIPDPEPELIRQLTGKSRALVEYLWKRGNVSLDTLRRDVWAGKPVKDKTIDNAADYANLKLAGLNLSQTKIEKRAGLFYLRHPQK